MANNLGSLPVIWFVPIGEQSFDAAFSNPLVLMLQVVGIGMFVMAFVLSSILMKRSTDVRTPMIVRWVMIESAAVLGLMAAFIGNDVRLFLPLAALAIAGMLVAYPRSEGGLAVPADRR